MWSDLLTKVSIWFSTTLASKETLIELSHIVAAALVARLLAKALRKQINSLGQRDTRFALLRRLWGT
ncbi:MAG: hypothetical protein ACJAYF_001499 [Arenicella sp.]|jgi:hypothetical protein